MINWSFQKYGFDWDLAWVKNFRGLYLRNGNSVTEHDKDRFYNRVTDMHIIINNIIISYQYRIMIIMHNNRK